MRLSDDNRIRERTKQCQTTLSQTTRLKLTQEENREEIIEKQLKNS